jgi:aspartate kinase
MSLVVQKYGGSSLATPEKIKTLAQRIIARYDSGDRLVIVVSAMGGTTNSLEAKAIELSPNPDPREVDMLISIGERESISLMAIAINAMRPGLAVSFTGSQIGLITDNNHRNARILEIKGDRLVEALKKNKIPIIAGFQGVSIDKQITTLGRGGSDTTAVAVSAALKADACEIYSDVIGVYSADPKICDAPVLIKELDYETMLTISSLGAKVLKDAAVEYAHRLGVKITTGLTWTGETGTTVSESGSLDKNKFASIIQNDKLSYKNEKNDNDIPADLSNIRFFQKSSSGSTIIYNHLPKDSGSIQCFSLAIVGSGLRSESDKLNEMKNILSLSNEIIALDLSEIKFEVYSKSLISREVFNKIHTVFFDN